MADQMAFVSAPAATPTINLSLNQPGLLKVKRDSFSLGAPSFEGDPYSMSAGYGERTVELTLQATGTYDEAMTVFQDVSQQLVLGAPGMGGRNWLMFRWSSADPLMFLWTLPSSLSALDFQNAGAGVWELPLSVVCDGYIFGANVDIASFTIANDPSAGTNRMMAGPSTITELDEIKGDAPTPLLLAMTAASPAFTPGYITSYALRGGFTHSFLARNLTDLTAGTDVGARVTGAGTDYVEGDYRSCSFATLTMTTRLSGTFASALSPMPGLYRALVKGVVPVPGAGSHVIDYTFQIQFGSTTGLSSSQYTDPVTVRTNPGFGGSPVHVMADLGVVQIPTGVEPSAIGLAPAASATSVSVFTTVNASASVVSGSIQPFRFDEVYLLPVETNYGSARSLVGVPSGFLSDLVMYDGIQDSIRQMDDTGSGAFSSTPYPTTSTINLRWVGGLPTVAPGANNYLMFVLGSGASGAGATTATTTWSARYYPRYVHPRPSAT